VFPDAPPGQAAAFERDAWHEVVRQTFLAADPALGPRAADACFDALFAHYGGRDAWRAREGAGDALRSFRKAGVGTAVVSNFDQRLHGILAALDLTDWLDLVWLPSDAGAAKPDPAAFAGALRALGVAPENALFVGDDAVRDVAGARAAGIRAVDVKSLATLADLPALFEREIPKEPLR
jgi:putative hydrolase of the HAD superfamily